MHSKKSNNSKSGIFIQGLRPFSSTVPRELKKKLKKGGYNFSNIVDNWNRIVGKNISSICYPNTVKMGKDMKDSIVVLNVIHGNEVNVEYAKNEIIEKVNNFFGYNFVNQIKQKIVQEKIKIEPTLKEKISDKNIFKKKLGELDNNNLKTSLNKLVRAFNEKND